MQTSEHTHFSQAEHQDLGGFFALSKFHTMASQPPKRSQELRRNLIDFSERHQSPESIHRVINEECNPFSYPKTIKICESGFNGSDMQ
jgi:hypothetical protein